MRMGAHQAGQQGALHLAPPSPIPPSLQVEQGILTLRTEQDLRRRPLTRPHKRPQLLLRRLQTRRRPQRSLVMSPAGQVQPCVQRVSDPSACSSPIADARAGTAAPPLRRAWTARTAVGLPHPRGPAGPPGPRPAAQRDGRTGMMTPWKLEVVWVP